MDQWYNDNQEFSRLKWLVDSVGLETAKDPEQDANHSRGLLAMTRAGCQAIFTYAEDAAEEENRTAILDKWIGVSVELSNRDSTDLPDGRQVTRPDKSGEVFPESR